MRYTMQHHWIEMRTWLLLGCTWVAVFTSCGGDDEPKSEDLGVMSDAAPPCEAREGDCPNVCTEGTGILGESCTDTDSCGCGLFCDEGRCQPYRGDFTGCLCDTPAGTLLPFATECTDETEGAPCNDLNPCTLDDQCQQGRCIGDPTPYPAACDDGNSCTSNDVCAGAVCQGQDKSDGERCDDHNLCTQNDHCIAGRCEAEPVNCENSSDQCNIGVCEPRTGECVARPKQMGEQCDDGNFCTLEDRCEAGICVSSRRVDCSDQETECLSALCDPLSGTCLRSPRPDGSFCDSDESACTEEVCEEGACVIQREVRCDLLCNDGTCDPSTGRCTGEPLADGTPCDDQDACTENSSCRGGVCFIEHLLCACDGMDEGALCDDGNPCTREARCNEDGECIALGFEQAGVECEVDGNLCTSGACNGEGTCIEGAPLDCTDAFTEEELGTCQIARCAPERGVCLPVNVDAGTTCETGDLCDESGLCVEGRCEALPRDCSGFDTPCEEGICNPATGDCEARGYPEGTPCEDGSLCTGAGRCIDQGEQSSCVSQIDTDLCDLCAGLNVGDQCDDGNACTAESTCVRRGATLVCLGATKRCDLDDFDGDLTPCQTLTCDPTNGDCVPQNLPISSRCDDGIQCTVRDACAGGDDGIITCIGDDIQRVELSCPEGASLLNPEGLTSVDGDHGLVDQCTRSARGQSPLDPHLIDELAPSDPHAKILSSLSLDQQTEWFALDLDAHDHIRIWVTDRCGQSIPLLTRLLNGSGERDLTSSERLSTQADASVISIDITQEGTYFVTVTLARSLEADEEELPYILHVDRASGTECDTDINCCAEERCGLVNAGVCAPIVQRESATNQTPISASRLLFQNADRVRQIGALSDRYERDWYKVRLTANHTYQFSTEGFCERSLNTFLSLYSDPTRNPIAVNDDRTDQLATEIPLTSMLSGFTPEVTADYYLEVKSSPSSSGQPFGYYTLTVDDISCNPQSDERTCACADQRCLPVLGEAEIGQCVPNFGEREPNLTAEEAQESESSLPRDTPMFGQISRVGDRDVFIVDLPAGRFDVVTRAYCGQLPINTALKVMNLSGQTLAFDQDSGTGRLAMINSFEVSVAQRYLIEVSGEGGHVGPYLVEVMTQELGGVGDPITGQCEVDVDCNCEDLVCSINEEGTRGCVPRSAEIEPNDRRINSTGIDFNARITGEISTVADLDLYRVTLGQDLLGEHVSFAVDPACDGLGLNAQLRVLDQDGVELQVGEPWREGHLNATAPLEVTSSVTYYLEVTGELGARGHYILSSQLVVPERYIPLAERTCYRDEQCMCNALRCASPLNTEGQCVPRGTLELEPNNLVNEARAINFSDLEVASVTGALTSLEDEDYYLFNIGPEQQWRRFDFAVSNLCDQPTPPLVAMQLFDPNGALITDIQGDHDEAGLALSRWTAHAQGSYLVRISYAQGAELTDHQSYTLSIRPEASCDPAHTQEEGFELGPCGCDVLSCDVSGANLFGSCALKQELTLEREPNNTPSLAMRLSAVGSPFNGVELYGRVDELGDHDYYRFAFDEEQRGGLFKISVDPFCAAFALPMSIEVTRSNGETVFAQDATGASLELQGREALPQGYFRVDGPESHRLELSLSSVGEEIIPNTGQYILNIEPLLCEVNEDCLCGAVECINQQCRARTTEEEPNDEVGTANASPLITYDQQGMATLYTSGYLSSPQQGLIDRDHWQLTGLIADTNAQKKVMLRTTAFCEAKLPSTYILLSRVDLGGGDSIVTLTQLEDERGSYFEATLTEPGTYVAQVSSSDEIGAYQLEVVIQDLSSVGNAEQ